jgi:hypothetical protein
MSVPAATAVKPAIKPKPKPRAPSSAAANTAGPVSENTTISTGTSSEIPVTAVRRTDLTTTAPAHATTSSNDTRSSSSNKVRSSKSEQQKSINMDANGFILRPDVREDEEQHVKLNEMIELLVAAGYFRARIRGLSDFDKIIGGICWAIEMCDMDVDIEHLLFHENLTIGQKM